MSFGIGQPVRRTEDPRFLTGSGVFVDDIDLPGQALLEDMHYDPDSGQLLTGSFMDYCMPRADDLPWFEMETNEVLCKTNPIGVKGCGEGGTVGAAPAVIGAVLDALAPLGVTDIAMPATPERVWRAIQKAAG